MDRQTDRQMEKLIWKGLGNLIGSTRLTMSLPVLHCACSGKIGAISGTETCQFQYCHRQGPIPELHSEHTVPLLVLSSASSSMVVHRIPLPELHSDTWCHFPVLSSASSGTVICSVPAPKLHSEHTVLFLVLIFCKGAVDA